MAQPYVGEIRMFGGNFRAGRLDVLRRARLLPISENEALFNLIGTTYGGDGEETFALPDLQGRIPIHIGTRADRDHLSTGRDRRRRAGHADDPADSDPHPSVARLRATWRTVNAAPDNVLAATTACNSLGLWHRRCRAITLAGSVISSGRRQPAARQHAAVSLRQLHHLAVRHLSEPDLGAWTMSIRSSPKSAFSHSTSRPRAGRSATASSCRSRRTPRCSRCSAPPMAATARAPSRCRTCRATRRCSRAKGPGLSLL